MYDRRSQTASNGIILNISELSHSIEHVTDVLDAKDATMPPNETCGDLKRCLEPGSGGGFAPACLDDVNAVQHDLTKQSSHVQMNNV